MSLDSQINQLRHASRKLIRELGILQLSKAKLKSTPQHWHALIEIHKEPDITIAKLSQLLLLSPSSVSRIVNSLIKDNLVSYKDGLDRREKYLQITPEGMIEIKNIDRFSNHKIKGAFEFLTENDKNQIVSAIEKYALALEKSRVTQEQVKILTLSTSRTIRKQIVNMIENIQSKEFSLPITEALNACVLRAEGDFHYNNSYNFWYAVDIDGKIIGSIGLKKIDNNNAEIKKFFIEKPYRGKGVSQKLMNVLIKAAFKHQFNNLYLGTVNILKAAQCFYEKYGFSRIEEKNLHVNFSKCPLDSVFFKSGVSKLYQKISSQND